MLLDTRIRLALNLLVAVIVVATVFYTTIEGWGLVDSLYFALSTATTVGYGDLVPTTVGSKIFTMIYMISSVGLLLYSVALIAQKRILFHLRFHGQENGKNKTNQINRRG